MDSEKLIARLEQERAKEEALAVEYGRKGDTLCYHQHASSERTWRRAIEIVKGFAPHD